MTDGCSRLEVAAVELGLQPSPFLSQSFKGTVSSAKITMIYYNLIIISQQAYLSNQTDQCDTVAP